jgi:hypothetical protein
MSKMKLTEFPKIRYTMMEYHLFSSLPKNGKKVGSADIAASREAMGAWDVKFPLKNITVTMNRLIEKIDANKEPFRLVKDAKYPGHPEVEYWVEPRAVRRKANGR